MSEQLYSIKETTLTGIADALRRKVGETKTITVEEPFPVTEVIKTYNATGFYTYEGGYTLTSTKMGEATIKGASKIKMDIAYDLPSGHALYIDVGSHDGSWTMTDNKKTIKGTGRQEIEFDGDTVTVFLDSRDYTMINKLGFYAEFIGFDENGERVTVLKPVTKEVKNTYKPTEMAAAIEASDIPEEALTITGACNYRFSHNGWNWFVEAAGDKLTTKDISNASNMFAYSNKLTSIPFDININNSTYIAMENMFNGCYALEEIGDINNAYPNAMDSMFGNCQRLRYLPTFNNLNLNRIYSYNYGSSAGMFQGCYSLRTIPEEFLKQLYTPLATGGYYCVFSTGFQNCYALDEIRGLNPTTGTIPSNMFSSTFKGCCRVKDILFVLQEDGTPYSVNWKSQTVDLTSYVGRASTSTSILNYNSGITADKRVTDDTSYQALKNDPDWWTMDIAYSRYNHDSAVNTINSLPITTNTGCVIKFTGASGSATDGGAINTLTEEEIAVAAAKGWTVTLV